MHKFIFWSIYYSRASCGDLLGDTKDDISVGPTLWYHLLLQGSYQNSLTHELPLEKNWHPFRNLLAIGFEMHFFFLFNHWVWSAHISNLCALSKHSLPCPPSRQARCLSSIIILPWRTHVQDHCVNITLIISSSKMSPLVLSMKLLDKLTQKGLLFSPPSKWGVFAPI